MLRLHWRTFSAALVRLGWLAWWVRLGLVDWNTLVTSLGSALGYRCSAGLHFWGGSNMNSLLRIILISTPEVSSVLWSISGSFAVLEGPVKIPLYVYGHKLSLSQALGKDDNECVITESQWTHQPPRRFGVFKVASKGVQWLSDLSSCCRETKRF